MKKLYIVIFSTLLAAANMAAAPLKTAPRKAQSVATPITLPATDITETAFTANWKAVAGASVYMVTVFEPITVTADGTYTVLEESFDLIKNGTYQEPYDPAVFYEDLSAAGYTYTPDWSAVLPVYAKGAVAGVIYSPYIDLTNDGGRYTVKLGITGYSGGMVMLTSTGSTEQSVELTLTTTGYNVFEVEFTNGIHDTFLTITDYGIMNDPEGAYTDKYDFLDDFAIEQNFKAGDTFLRLIETIETDEDVPTTSWRFDDMKFRDGATRLAYDVMAIAVEYTDPDDPWEYDVYYSDYSTLEYVVLANGIDDIELDTTAPVEYFNLQGVAVKGDLTPGLYIRRQGSKTAKVIVR